MRIKRTYEVWGGIETEQGGRDATSWRSKDKPHDWGFSLDNKVGATAEEITIGFDCEEDAFEAAAQQEHERLVEMSMGGDK